MRDRDYVGEVIAEDAAERDPLRVSIIACKVDESCGESAKAGGEVEVWKWTIKGMVADPEYLQYSKKAFVRLPVVTRLQAEVGQWKSVSQDIAERRDELKRELDMRDGQRDALKAEVERLKDKYQRDVYGLNNEGDPIGGDPAGGYANDLARLQSELTKARELLATGRSIVRGSEYKVNGGIAWLYSVENFLAHQSAPSCKHEWVQGACHACGMTDEQVKS